MNNLDINPRITAAVIRAKLDNFGLVLSLSAPDLERATKLSSSDVSKLQKAVADVVRPKSNVTALNIFFGDCPDHLTRLYLSTGCPVLDEFFRGQGGIISPGITEIAGESASGKTQLCMQLSITAQLPKSLGGLQGGAMYICTEDVFPNKRLMQMVDLLKKRVHDPFVKKHCFPDHIFIEHAADINDLWYCVNRKIPVLLGQGRVRLIIIDSIAALFRCEFDSNETVKRAKKLSSFAAQLHKLSSKYNTPVVSVNQVADLINKNAAATSLSNNNKVTPALGISWANLVTCRIMLTRTSKQITIERKNNSGATQTLETAVRSMEVIFAPHLPNSVCFYVIDHEGVKGLS